jgi:hypothetical protein
VNLTHLREDWKERIRVLCLETFIACASDIPMDSNLTKAMLFYWRILRPHCTTPFPVTSDQISWTIRCSKPNHVGLLSSSLRNFKSAPVRVLGRGLVVSTSLIASRSLGEGGTSCENASPRRDAWLICVLCFCTCSTSPAL